MKAILERTILNIRCCIQVQESLDKAILLNADFRYGMERGGICISFTIVKTAFMVWTGQFLQTGKMAGAQAPFDVYVCTCLVLPVGVTVY